MHVRSALRRLPKKNPLAVLAKRDRMDTPIDVVLVIVCLGIGHTVSVRPRILVFLNEDLTTTHTNNGGRVTVGVVQNRGTVTNLGLTRVFSPDKS